MVPDLLVKDHKNTTTCSTAIVKNKQSKKCYFKIRSNRHGQSYAIWGQFGSNAVKFYFTLSYYFLLVFFKSLNFRKPPWKPFLGIFPSLKLFPSISNSFQLFFLKNRFRCGNSVDFLYGGLIVRVSSCLSAFRSFALHTFFQIT